MTIKTKILAIFLSMVLCCLFLSACQPTDDPQKDDEIPASSYNLAENGATDYVIVVPQNATSDELAAANELQTYLQLSSSVTLPIVTDENRTFSEENNHISIGSTQILSESGVVVDQNELGKSGYVLKRLGKTLIAAGPNATNHHGTLNAVYDMLQYTIGLIFYAEDELAYETKSVVPLLDFDIKYIPSIDVRIIKMKDICSDELYMQHMKLENDDVSLWASFAHTTFQFLPPETYQAEHPDWYANDGSQLCFSNPEVVDAMVSAVEKRLDSFSSANYLMIGMQDTSSMCTCDNCVAEREKYGNFGGQQLNFVNRVAEQVDVWLADAYPGRKVTYCFFAYLSSENPPVTYDSATQTYSFVGEQITPYKNVGVMLAPISMDFSKEVTDSVNSASYENIKGWSYIFGQQNLFVWSYSLLAYSYFCNFDNFGTVANYYKYFADLGVECVYDQGQYDSRTSCFEEMRVYVQSRLMYDTSLNYTELAEDFISHYYGDGAEKVLEYYNLIRSYYDYLRQKYNASPGVVFYRLDTTAEYWPMQILNTMLGILDDAIEDIEPLKATDPDRYQTLYDRIMKEKLSPMYLMLSLHIDYLTEEERERYISEFETYTTKYEIICANEGGNNVADIIQEWKNR